MQMSLGKFKEQQAGSEAPASVTSPPTRLCPRFAERSKGLQGPYSKSKDTHGNPLVDTLRAPPVTCYFHENYKLSIFTCHTQNGCWALGFYYEPFIFSSLSVSADV